MNSEEIIKYIDGEMDEASAKSFESRLKSDAVLNRNYHLHLAANKAGKGMLEAEIRSYFEEENTNPDEPSKRQMSMLSLFLMALVLVIAIYYTYSSFISAKEKSENSLYAANFKEPIWPVERGSQDLLSKAISLHLKAKTDEAIQILKADGNFDLQDKYWTAEMLMHINKKEEAKNLLKELSAADPNLFSESQQKRIKYLLTL